MTLSPREIAVLLKLVETILRMRRMWPRAGAWTAAEHAWATGMRHELNELVEAELIALRDRLWRET